MWEELVHNLTSTPTAGAMLFAMLYLAAGGYILIGLGKMPTTSPLRDYMLPIAGAVIILPTLLVFALTGHITDQALTGMLGLILGVIFGHVGAALVRPPASAQTQTAAQTPTTADALARLEALNQAARQTHGADREGLASHRPRSTAAEQKES